jgi:hypothetical protein
MQHLHGLLDRRSRVALLGLGDPAGKLVAVGEGHGVERGPGGRVGR